MKFRLAFKVLSVCGIPKDFSYFLFKCRRVKQLALERALSLWKKKKKHVIQPLPILQLRKLRPLLVDGLSEVHPLGLMTLLQSTTGLSFHSSLPHNEEMQQISERMSLNYFEPCDLMDLCACPSPSTRMEAPRGRDFPVFCS